MGSSSFNSYIPWTSVPSTANNYFKRTIQNPSSLITISKLFSLNKFCSATSASQLPSTSSNDSGIKLEETVDGKTKRLRLDQWVSSRITADGVSRARVQYSIRSGLVSVNGRVITKVSHMVRGGDRVACKIAELQPLRAEPEDIPLDIVYEDDHVLVVNKPADMVVHPAPGNASGTLVNGILHHCSLPTMESLPSQPSVEEDALSEADDDDDLDIAYSGSSDQSSIRPGIVHRLDKGTSGLLVVAKDAHSHAHLAEQFKSRTIKRVYVSLTCGVPSPDSGRVEVPIGRDLNNRIRMAAFPATGGKGKTRYAASRYKVIEVLANGGSALVEWRLETGRTHQIRVHAKYLGFPLLGDELYGGTKGLTTSWILPRVSSGFHDKLQRLISCTLERPCLHALSLGFVHPYTGEKMHFSRLPPPDFAEILNLLREISSIKVN